MDNILVQDKLTTYLTGILQAKAYRILRSKIGDALKRFDLSTTEWAIIGIVYEAEKVTAGRITKILDVEFPLVTRMINSLEKKKFIKKVANKKDKRSRFISLTKYGLEITPTIESLTKKEVRGLIDDITPEELRIYVKVLESLSKNL